MDVVAGAGVAIAVLATAFVVLVGRMISSTRIRGVDPDWLRRFSTDVYRPMKRLLSDDDINFLRNQPGFEPSIEREFRRDRIRIFRAYLRALGKDFNRLHLALRLTVLHAQEDRSDLAVALIRQKALFFAGLAMAHTRLTLYGWGIGTVDVSGLVGALEGMRFQIRDLTPRPQLIS